MMERDRYTLSIGRLGNGNSNGNATRETQPGRSGPSATTDGTSRGARETNTQGFTKRLLPHNKSTSNDAGEGGIR